MFHSDKQLLQHIFDEIMFLEDEVNRLTEATFLDDAKSQRAFARSIEIIGEAVKNISEETVINNPSIEWRKIAGMRDKLIHGYFSVNYKLVWDVAKNIIPKLKIQLYSILENMK
jgi:uncharacterized protein with HEPN domain